MKDEMKTNDIVLTSIFLALEAILEYAKYLEDNGQLSYDLLSQRVETYKKQLGSNLNER